MAVVTQIHESKFPFNRIGLSSLKCSLCNLCSSYTPQNKEEGDCIHEYIKREDTINRGEYLFKEHCSFESIFSVRSGAFKTYAETEDGEVQITGFYLPGDIIGLDSTNTNTYNCSAKALEFSSFCEISFLQIEALASKNSEVQHHFFSLMSAEIQTSRHLTWLLSKKSAEERIAFFLLNLSTRFKQRNLSATHFRLPMSRIDISNYLGLAVETISRVFTRFQNMGLITAEGRELVLNDIVALTDITKHDM